MYRYIALHWQPSDRSASEYSQRLVEGLNPAIWSLVYREDGLLIAHTGDRSNQMQSYHFASSKGVVLGKLFRRTEHGGLNCPRDFDESETSDIVATRGRSLIHNFWGRYAAFIRIGPDDLCVIADPTGSLPCYYADRNGIRIFASRAEDMIPLGVDTSQIDWEGIAEHLVLRSIGGGLTGFSEVQEVSPGHACSVGARQGMELYWNPDAISDGEPIEDGAKAVAELRATVLGCVSAWASGYGRVLHRLSGGLDSSLVLHCLSVANRRPDITCVNFYTATRDGDERGLARLAARNAGCELVERDILPGQLDLTKLLAIQPSAKPSNLLYFLHQGRLEAELAAQFDAEASFTGAGGDGIFYQGRSEVPPLDYVHSHGFGLHFLKVAWEAARLQRTSIWSVLRNSVRSAAATQCWNPYAAYFSSLDLIDPDVMQQCADRKEQELSRRASTNLPGGKRDHIAMMMSSPLYYDPSGYPDYPEPVYPLISQPLVELCLRIPTYILTQGGIDRGLVRNAFLNDLPHAIVAREGKGGLDAYMREVLGSNLSWIREILLDGVLAGRGLLNRVELEKRLHRCRSDIFDADLQLLDHLCTEAWLRCVGARQ